MMGKLRTLQSVSLPVWIVGSIMITVLWLFLVIWLVNLSQSYKPFTLETRTWIESSSWLVVQGTCGVEAGSKARFALQNSYDPAKTLTPRLVSGQELGSLEKVYSMTAYVEPGVWSFVFFSDPGPEKPPKEQVEVVARCLDGAIFTNVVTDMSVVWVFIFLGLLFASWLIYAWSGLMRVRFHK